MAQHVECITQPVITQEWDSELIDNAAASSVGCDHVPGAYRQRIVGKTVTHQNGHTALILLKGLQLRVEAYLRAGARRLGYKDRLELRLREVAHRAGAR